MTRGLDASTERFLSTLETIQNRLERAHRQVSSGRRLETVSDGPDQVAGLLQSRAELGRMRQMRANLGRTQGEVDAAEQALQQAVKLVDRAAVVGAQGATGTQTAATRLSLAGEVEAILTQLVGLSNSAADGRCLFSGDADQTTPYSLNLAADPPYGVYNGSAATRQALHPSGVKFNVTHTAWQIFENGDPAKNVFASVNALRTALASNDEQAIRSSLGALKSAGDHLNSELAFYGAVQNQVSEALDSAQRRGVSLKTRLSEIEDADITAAILELSQAQYQQEAALASRARMPRQSLFDFLG